MTASIGMPTEASPLLLDPDTEASSETLADDEEELRRVDSNVANQSVGSLRAVLIILSLWVLIFLQASNMSGLTTTQSTIAADLDAFKEASWFTSSYLIAISSIAPLAGRLSQIFSARNCIFVSSIIFSVGALVTAQAPSFSLFLTGRVMSGVGAAGILTISIILVLELTGKKRRGLFIGLVNAGYTSGVALGAVIAGALLPVAGWRVLFGAQAPLALLAGIAVFFSIPKSFVSGPLAAQGPEKETIQQKLAKIDYFGAFTLTSSIVLFLYGMASAQIQWIPIAISPVLLTMFTFNEIYLAKIPIIPVSVLKSRGALLTCLAQLGFMAARWMVLFYSPVYAIAVRGWAPAAAGSMLIPTNLGFASGGLIVGWLHIRRSGSFYLPCVVAFILFSITLFILGQLSTANSAAVWYFVATFVNGFCTGAALNYTLAHILHLTLPQTHFIVTSLLATFRGFAGSFGSAIGGGIFARILESALVQGFAERGLTGKEELIRKLLGGPALVSGLEGDEKAVAVAGYVTALQGLFTTASGLALLMVFVQAGTGWRPAADEKPDETLQEDDGEGHED